MMLKTTRYPYGNNWNSTITWHHTQIISQNSLSVCEISRGKNRQKSLKLGESKDVMTGQKHEIQENVDVCGYIDFIKIKTALQKKAVKKWKNKLEIRWYTYLTKTFKVEQRALKLKIRTHTYTHNFKCPKGLNRHFIKENKQMANSTWKDAQC